LTLILPPTWPPPDLGELLHAGHERVALGVLGGELDGFVLGLCHTEGGKGDGGGDGFEDQTFHGLSPEKGQWMWLYANDEQPVAASAWLPCQRSGPAPSPSEGTATIRNITRTAPS
jgi:hypothetical protein